LKETQPGGEQLILIRPLDARATSSFEMMDPQYGWGAGEPDF
jgi:hypothetical protein